MAIPKRTGTHTSGRIGLRIMALTHKQEQFVHEFLVDLNATQAAIRAGYSSRTARAIGQENLTKPAIHQAVDAAIQERQARVEVTQDMVIEGLLKEARTATADSARVSAWNLLGKHLAMFVEKRQVSGSVTMEQYLDGTWEKRQ